MILSRAYPFVLYKIYAEGQPKLFRGCPSLLILLKQYFIVIYLVSHFR